MATHMVSYIYTYVGKPNRCLIIDLFSPHGSFILNINSVIPSPDFSIMASASSVWHDMELGFLNKTTPVHSKSCPFIHTSGVFFWVCCKGPFYFSVRLTFRRRSSPKIFDSLSEAPCSVLHLLDDFLVITSPSSTSHRANHSDKNFLWTWHPSFQREKVRAKHFRRLLRHHPEPLIFFALS